VGERGGQLHARSPAHPRSCGPGPGLRGPFCSLFHDSVVVYDRNQGTGRQDPKEPFAHIADQALLQTLPRTVNTGRGAALVLGGETLTDFALALLTGLVVGTYSSMFTATPLAIELHKRT
jgi:SecD/SecF fusion protein